MCPMPVRHRPLRCHHRGCPPPRGSWGYAQACPSRRRWRRPRRPGHLRSAGSRRKSSPPRVDTESATSYPLDVEHELARQRSEGSVAACSGSRSRRGRAAQARQAALPIRRVAQPRSFSLPLASRARPCRCCSDLRQARQREILRTVVAVASCGAPLRMSVAAVAGTVAASSGASS
jgi:hypothetical protein